MYEARRLDSAGSDSGLLPVADLPAKEAEVQWKLLRVQQMSKINPWLPTRGANFLAGRARSQWRTGLVYDPGLLGSAR